MIVDFDPTTQEYIEIIYEIQKDRHVARVKDIAERRGVTKSSVSTVLTQLKQKELINHETYGLVMLTAKGRAVAETLEETHQLIRDFFVDILNVDPEIAEDNACTIEHHINKDVLSSLADFMSFLKTEADVISRWKHT
ncbi:metal-dependent transcriptional regulator [candidate division KSB1 bacterium]|nr:metal-dependent transcriptional regulator [candidate division KSB1 bacterium]